MGRLMGRLMEKRAATTLAAMSGFALAVAASLPAWHAVERESSAAEQADVGAMLARQLAADAEEPLLRQDRVSLGVVVNRMASREMVRHAAIFAADGQPLAVAGESPNPNAVVFSEPLVLADTLAAEARLALVADAFATPLAGMLAIAWPFWAGGLVLAVVALLFGGTVAGWWRGQTPAAEAAPPALDPAREAGAGEDPTGLVVANLGDRLELPSATPGRALQAAAAVAERVGRIYGARAITLPNTGAALTFGSPASRDRTFNMACAALLLRRALDRCAVATDEAGRGVAAGGLFRYAVALVPVAVAPDARAFATTARDALLLSAVAGEGEIVISKNALAALEGPDRLRLGDFAIPAAPAIGGPVPAGVVLGVNAEYETLLDHQADSVTASRSN